MPAQDYQVGFGYGATDGYYYGPKGVIGAYHRGNDFYTPPGTDLVINGQSLGKTGATGKVSGAHVHVQLSPEANPTGREWQVPDGVVTETGQTPIEGKYIKVRGSDGYTRMYFHLSEINARVGQKVGNMGASQTPVDATTIQLEWNNAFLENAPADAVSSRVAAGQTVEQLQRELQAAPQHLQVMADQQYGVKARQQRWEQKSVDLGKAVDILTKENQSLKAQVGDSGKWETLKALVRELVGKA